VESVYGEKETFTVWLQTGSPSLDQVLEVRTEVELISAAVELADLELVGETSVQERASHTKDASAGVANYGIVGC